MSLVGFKASNHPQQVGKRGATERDNLGTDPTLYARLNQRFRFTLDVAATAANAKCERYFDLEADGLARRWDGRVWCNPPYSQLHPWVEKAWTEWTGRSELPPPMRLDLIVMLVPANRPEQAWWQELVEPYRDRPGTELRTEFLRGRQRFVMPGAEAIGPNERPPFGCVLLIWNAPHSAPTATPASTPEPQQFDGYGAAQMSTERTPVDFRLRPIEQRVWKVDTVPCPECGNKSVIGFLYLDQHGHHQHTHYVCTFWSSPDDKSVYLQPDYNPSEDRCGWHGWSVPDGDED